jgi:CubicO group peptidase (beta-lactamase class C family)
MRIIPLIALAIALAPGGQADRIDEYVRSQLKSGHLPGVSLAVVKDGRIVKAAGYGLASLELDAAATEQTVRGHVRPGCGHSRTGAEAGSSGE